MKCYKCYHVTNCKYYKQNVEPEISDNLAYAEAVEKLKPDFKCPTFKHESR